MIQVCLFGEEEWSLRDEMRKGASDEQLETIIENALGRKKAVLGGHNNMHNVAQGTNRPMILIGG